MMKENQNDNGLKEKINENENENQNGLKQKENE
jgi:hypothetical protein